MPYQSYQRKNVPPPIKATCPQCTVCPQPLIPFSRTSLTHPSPLSFTEPESPFLLDHSYKHSNMLLPWLHNPSPSPKSFFYFPLKQQFSRIICNHCLLFLSNLFSSDSSTPAINCPSQAQNSHAPNSVDTSLFSSYATFSNI